VLRGDVELAPVVGGHRQRHAAVEHEVDRVAHVEVVLGEQELRVVLARRRRRDQRGIPRRVRVVDTCRRQVVAQHGARQGEELPHQPEAVDQGEVEGGQPVVGRDHELLGAQQGPQREVPRTRVHPGVVELPHGLGVAVEHPLHGVQQLVGEPVPSRRPHPQVSRGERSEVVHVLRHAEVDGPDPHHVAGHSVEVLVGAVAVPGEVDDAEGEVLVALDDVVDDGRDAALEVGVGGLGDDGDIDVGIGRRLVDGHGWLLDVVDARGGLGEVGVVVLGGRVQRRAAQPPHQAVAWRQKSANSEVRHCVSASRRAVAKMSSSPTTSHP